MPDQLTTNQGSPVADNQNSLTAGSRGPTLVADHHLLEKLAHLNRERIPERVVGALGATAFGTFQPAEDLAQFTKASVFTRDRSTPVATRFSMFTHSRHAPETLRDLRGMSVKFYSSQGNYDIATGTLPVFFIRDAMKFADLVHALKPDPVTATHDPARLFDFLSFLPEATHMLVWLYSDMGIPRGYRHMPAFSVNTYIWINGKGSARNVRYHWRPSAGEAYFTQDEAASMQAKDFSHATRDLYATLHSGSAVEYDLYVQIMEFEDEQQLGHDPLDATVMWPDDRWPLIHAGHMTLNRATLNDFAEGEQLAFSPSAVVPGIELSADKLLHGRAFAYPDAQRYRLGANYLQLPVNRPRIAVHNQQQDGAMALEFEDSSTNYEPNIAARHLAAGEGLDWSQPLEPAVARQRLALVDDFAQAGASWRSFSGPMRVSVIRNLGDELARVGNAKVVQTICGYLRQADAYLGDAVLRRARGQLDDLAAVEADLSAQSEQPASPEIEADEAAPPEAVPEQPAAQEIEPEAPAPPEIQPEAQPQEAAPAEEPAATSDH